MLAPEYSIEEVNLVMYGGRIKPLVSQATPSQGSGLYLAQRITPPDKVNVKVSLNYNGTYVYMFMFMYVYIVNVQVYLKCKW